MEPTIYKPSAYKTPGVYKGAGGIYKGRGIYNDGEGGGGGDYAEIGGRKYRIVTIGTQTWLAENLDYEFPGCAINPGGSPSTPAAFYKNDNYRQTYGLLYNWHAVKYLNDNRAELMPGWHVPSEEEYQTLFSEVGGIGKTPNVMRANSWSGGDTDIFGFTALPAGFYSSGIFNNVGASANFSTITYYGSVNIGYWELRAKGSSISTESRSTGLSLRVLRDST